MRYDKLVRDKIPKIIREDDETPHTHIADDEEYMEKLNEKLQEEVDEFLEDGETEELADILEVIEAIRSFRDVSERQLEEIKESKAEERGRFEDKIVLEKIEE